MKSLFFFQFILLSLITQAQESPFEKSKGRESATYFQAIDFYKKLASKSPLIKVETHGITDAGYPLNLVLISNDEKFIPAAWHSQKKVVILINNGIHPGEPDGIDASIMLARDVVQRKIVLPNNVVLAIVPLYNIGGALNRDSFSRVNQNGPVAYGFRGNSQNLDLNRDFIKCDSREAKVFTEIFHYVNPDILIDNHVSDGADYQHVMTLITTQYDKLGEALGGWLKNTFVPLLFSGMKEKGWDLVPYVNVEDTDPSKGFVQFYDEPRYSTGYAALFNTIGFMPETHMLKSYSERVRSTYDLMATIIQRCGLNAGELLEKRKAAIETTIHQKQFALSWQPDSSKFSNIFFKGYEARYKTSDATGMPVLYYDHGRPFTKEVKFYDSYAPQNFVTAPSAYIIPQGWWAIMDLLILNQVKVTRLSRDSTLDVSAYHITGYKSYTTAYEKHHRNYQVTVSKSTEQIKFLKGDFLINMDQAANRYIIETLEPVGEDGFFAWNFFDAMLQQKEGYSDYRWDSIAERVLQKDALLQQKLADRRQADSIFAKDAGAQLIFIYKNSRYFEPGFLRYPVYRIEQSHLSKL